MLDGFAPETDEKKKLLYVALTRAKSNLSVHLNGTYLDDISCSGLQRDFDKGAYEESDLLVLHLTHKDIWLDYFVTKQHLLTNLKSGDKLQVNNDGCYNENRDCVVKFSISFKENLATYLNKGYKLTNAEINFIVFWQKEDTEIEVKVILPELKLQKS